jgi:uncharacterized membrane protein YdjX (TVP38/TMEM64 family)
MAKSKRTSMPRQPARKARKKTGRKAALRKRPLTITRSHWVTAGVVLLAAAGIWLAREPVGTYLTFVADKPAFSAYIKSFGFWGPFVIIAFQILQVIFAMIPGYAFYIGAGYIYGIPIAYPMSLISTVIGSQIAFAIGRYLGRPVVYKLAPKDVILRWDSRARKFGFLFFLTSFLLPIFPADTMNYLAGLTGIDGKKFLLASVLGRAPAILFLTSMGAFGLELTTMGLPWTTWALIAICCIGLYWGWQWIFHKLKPESLKF